MDATYAACAVFFKCKLSEMGRSCQDSLRDDGLGSGEWCPAALAVEDAGHPWIVRDRELYGAVVQAAVQAGIEVEG